jgi:WD40 repeat protein
VKNPERTATLTIAAKETTPAEPNADSPESTHVSPSAAAPGLAAAPIPIDLENLPTLGEAARLGNGRATGLDWSPDGGSVAVATWNGIFLLKGSSLETSGQLLSGTPVLKTAYTADGQALLVLTRAGEFKAVRTADGKKLRETTFSSFQDGAVTALNPAQYLAAVSNYDLARAQSSLFLRKATGDDELEIQTGREITSLAFSPNGALLAAGASDGNITLYETKAGGERKACRLHTGPVTSLAFSSDGTRLLSGSDDRSVRICDLARTVQAVSISPKTQPIQVGFSYGADGERVFAALPDGSIQMWDPGSGKSLAALTGAAFPIRAAVPNPDGSALLALSDDGALRLWALSQPAAEKFAPSLTNTAFPAPVLGIDLSPDRQTIAAGYQDGSVRLWSLADGSLLREMRPSPPGLFSTAGRVLFSPSGKYLVSLEGKLLRLWDPDNGSLLQTFAGHQNNVLSAAFSPDETRLASVATDRTVQIWDLAGRGNRPLRAITAFNDAVAGVRFSQDGTSLVTIAWDQAIQTWNVEDGKLLNTVHGGPGKNTTAIIFPPDDRLLAAVSDGAAEVWWRENFSSRWSYAGSLVSAMTFSSSGDLIVTGGHAIRFWDFKSSELGGGAPAREIPATSWVSAVQFSRDGSLFVSADRESGIITIWRIAP